MTPGGFDKKPLKRVRNNHFIPIVCLAIVRHLYFAAKFNYEPAKHRIVFHAKWRNLSMYRENITRENQAQNRTNECIKSALRDLTKLVDLVSNQGQLMPFDLEPGATYRWCDV